MTNKPLVLSTDKIKSRIYTIRDMQVMLDKDLAELYNVKAIRLREQIKRNPKRFPADFMFKFNKEENLRFQFGTSSFSHGGSRYLPYVFTEHGVAMLSSVLNSKKAIEMNIFIIRAFIKMRESLDNYKDLSVKIGEIELKQRDQGVLLTHVHSAVKDLINKSVIEKPFKQKRKIGFNKK